MNQLTQPSFMETELKKFDVNEAAIAEVTKKYSSLSINGFEDKQGYQAVRTARLDVKGMRVLVEKKRKELGQDALEWGRKINARAKQLSKPLEDLEYYLEGHENAYEAEKERIKKEKEEAELLALNTRIHKLLQAGMQFDGFQYFIPWPLSATTPNPSISPVVLKLMPNERFEQFLTDVLDLQKREKERLELLAIEEANEIQRLEAIRAEEAAIKAAEEAVEAARLETLRYQQAIENERLETIQRAQDEANAAIKAKEEALEAEIARIEQEKYEMAQQKLRDEEAKRHAIEIEEARQEAAKEALRQEAERIERERIQAMADDMAEAARVIEERERLEVETARQEELKSDKTKLEDLALSLPYIFSKIMIPVLKNKECEEITTKMQSMLIDVQNYIESEIKKL